MTWFWFFSLLDKKDKRRWQCKLGWHEFGAHTNFKIGFTSFDCIHKPCEAFDIPGFY